MGAIRRTGRRLLCRFASVRDRAHVKVSFFVVFGTNDFRNHLALLEGHLRGGFSRRLLLLLSWWRLFVTTNCFSWKCGRSSIWPSSGILLLLFLVGLGQEKNRMSRFVLTVKGGSSSRGSSTLAIAFIRCGLLVLLVLGSRDRVEAGSRSSFVMSSGGDHVHSMRMVLMVGRWCCGWNIDHDHSSSSSRCTSVNDWRTVGKHHSIVRISRHGLRSHEMGVFRKIGGFLGWDDVVVWHGGTKMWFLKSPRECGFNV
mmetsp:Transcript_15988/g.33047  ORF Transcript_15988/g.33047 Transcript_15988/m.33047 type:complete len:255 (+) Transcript_15988:1276-2040(+)